MRKIVIIEDDINYLHALEVQFKLRNFETFTNDGSDELERVFWFLKEKRPDYLMMDIILPRFDGFELLGRVKGDQDFYKLKYFIFSDLSENDCKERGYPVGDEHFLIKQELIIEEAVDKVIKIIKNKEKIPH